MEQTKHFWSHFYHRKPRAAAFLAMNFGKVCETGPGNLPEAIQRLSISWNILLWCLQCILDLQCGG